MSISENLDIDIKKAMLAKDKIRLSALRAIRAAFLIEKTKQGSSGSISDEKAIGIINKLYKQRIEAQKIYIDQNRQDLANEENSQAKVLQEFLPKQMTADELEKELKILINDIGATSMADMGKVMTKAMAVYKGKADGSLISRTVKDLLG